MFCTKCGAKNEGKVLNCTQCGAVLKVSTATADNTLGGLIPYKNSAALIAYYLAVFSLIPCVGLFLGIAAVILGIKGLKFYEKNPQAGGKVHAWIGIILGGLISVIYAIVIIILIFANITGGR